MTSYTIAECLRWLGFLIGTIAIAFIIAGIVFPFMAWLIQLSGIGVLGVGLFLAGAGLFYLGEYIRPYGRNKL